jgi:hypothetical protein
VRPRAQTEKLAKMLDENTNKYMDKVFAGLSEFLQDEAKYAKTAPMTSLDLDHLAWIAGAATSISLRSLAGWLGPMLFSSLQGSDQMSNFLRLAGVLGVVFGATAAGLVKRRNPLKGNAFFEGFIVGLANVIMSILFYKPYFTIGCVDWAIYGMTGVTLAALASQQFGKKPG